MSLGGRPKEEEGHTRKRFSLNKETCDGLNKIPQGERSKFIENTVCPVLRQLDPGPSCEVLERVDSLLGSEIGSALSTRDYEKATAITALANSLAPFRRLCRVPEEDNASRK